MRPVGYSYIRFSTPGQAGGDSLRRQTQAAVEWCKRKKVTLDTGTTLHDLGRSAFSGKHRINPDRNALAAFLDLVERGRIPRGSFLIVESLDRLSREDIRPALGLLLNLIEAGVRVVQLIPVEAVYDDKVEPLQLMMAIVELSRGNSVSRVKSERIRAAWETKREAARTTGRTAAGRMPAWFKFEQRQSKAGRTVNAVVVRDGRPVLDPDKAAVVQRIFRMVADGVGLTLIVKTLTAEGVPPMGASSGWTRSYVSKILSEPRAAGTYQPRDSDGKPAGDAIEGYYPAVVTQAEFHAAQASMGNRRHRRGRPSTAVHLFSGLIRDALGRGNFCTVPRVSPQGKRDLILMPTAAVHGSGVRRSFPLAVFERAVLQKLTELSVREVFGDANRTSPAATLAAQVARVEESMAEIEAELMDGGTVATLAKVLRAKEAQRTELLAKLAEARQQEANPLAETWGELGTLADALDKAADQTEARLRLRSALRRVVESIYLVVVGRGRTRVAAAQFQIRGGAVRSFVITSTPPMPRGGRGSRRVSAASWEVRSFAGPDGGGLDLSDPAQARKLAAVLGGKRAER